MSHSKNAKLNISELKVQSFVTDLAGRSRSTVKIAGGDLPFTNQNETNYCQTVNLEECATSTYHEILCGLMSNGCFP
jgi:hypothetical protein